ncbi:hypothetical protein [Brumimicrobium mesophilum]|uniref:hypothetical protein n=1 Tax=Brumimicrobium mesophilum TaxID=392717 RepID=UPI000D144333|nr:hypothetical protein [Brumimicrobium mesophilum]
MKTLIKILLLTSVFLLVLFACKKDQLEITKTADPCDCASEVSADFDILERHSQIANSVLIETDHVFANKQVIFRSSLNDAEYKWYIGAHIETGQEAFKHFTTQWIGSTIPITLVVKKEPNKICFPNDDGYDSITKTFNVYTHCRENYLLEGTFRMASKNSTDSIDIELEFKEYTPWNDCYSVDITNFDGVGSICPGNYFRVTKSYRYLHSAGTATGSCQSLGGGFRAWHHLNGTCEMKYRYYKDNDISQQVQKHLFGRKLN